MRDVVLELLSFASFPVYGLGGVSTRKRPPSFKARIVPQILECLTVQHNYMNALAAVISGLQSLAVVHKAPRRSVVDAICTRAVARTLD